MEFDLDVAAGEARALRDELGVGIEAAKRILKKERIAAAIGQAQTVDDLKMLLFATLKLIPV